jgi:hypothetical protein
LDRAARLRIAGAKALVDETIAEAKAKEQDSFIMNDTSKDLEKSFDDGV